MASLRKRGKYYWCEFRKYSDNSIKARTHFSLKETNRYEAEQTLKPPYRSSVFHLDENKRQENNLWLDELLQRVRNAPIR